MEKRTIRTLVFCIMLILFASCNHLENEEDIVEYIITEDPENISDDITLEPTLTEEDILNDDDSDSTEPDQEFEDTAPEGITYIKKEPDYFYLSSKELSDFGYITKIEKSEITVNHVRWISHLDDEWDDSWTENGYDMFYILDDSETDLQHTIAEDCEIWILHNYSYPHYQISFDDLITYIDMTNWDILWRFEIVDEKIITIVEQYVN